MDKQQKRMVYQYHDNILLFFLFAESGGQTHGNFERQNIAGNAKDSKYNS